MANSARRVEDYLTKAGKIYSRDDGPFSLDMFLCDVRRGKVTYDGQELHVSKSDRLYVKHRLGKITTPRFVSVKEILQDYIPKEQGCQQQMQNNRPQTQSSLLDYMRDRYGASKPREGLHSLRDDAIDSVSTVEKKILPGLAQIAKEYESAGYQRDDLVKCVDDYLHVLQTGLKTNAGVAHLSSDGKVVDSLDSTIQYSPNLLFKQFAEDHLPKQRLYSRLAKTLKEEASAWLDAATDVYDLMDQTIVKPFVDTAFDAATSAFSTLDTIVDETTRMIAYAPRPTLNRPRLAYATIDIGGELMGLREPKPSSKIENVMEKAVSWMRSWF